MDYTLFLSDFIVSVANANGADTPDWPVVKK